MSGARHSLAEVKSEELTRKEYLVVGSMESSLFKQLGTLINWWVVDNNAYKLLKIGSCK